MKNAGAAIRKATRADAPAMHELHTASVTVLCSTHYDIDALRRRIANRTPEGYFEGIDRGEMFVCELDGCMAGFGHAVPGEIKAVFVHPDFARRGIGGLLVRHALSVAESGGQPVKLIATLNAAPFYEKQGFIERERYTVKHNNVDVPIVEMWRPASPAQEGGRH